MKKENKQLAKQLRAEALKKKKQKRILCIVLSVVLVAVAAIGIGIGVKIANRPFTLKYSKYLTADGKIKDVNIADYVKLGDMKEILKANKDEVIPTEQEVHVQMMQTISDGKKLNEDKLLTVADGDYINLDYVGYIGDKAFEGGDTEEKGTDLVIGSGSYIDGFEEQLIGHHPDEKFEIKVTFPEDYSNEELKGKEATFKIVINGIYQLNLDDEKVKKKTEYETVNEFKEETEKKMRQDRMRTALWDALYEKCEVTGYPEAYFQNLQDVMYVLYEQQYEYYNALYTQYYGYEMWKSIEDYYGMTVSELKEELKDLAKEQADQVMIAQMIFEQEGLTISDEEREEYLVNYGYKADAYDEAVENSGKGYIEQGAMVLAVTNYLVEKMEVVEIPEADK
ncbi:MAG: FKBP-type peptidyl-prolyl cis-trans isomerase [Lachnospiraceae bacterium]|nr:FKBP-type peptidyl-prolyl cis-trans isomerase [Lachnospiraceae bacterium]